MQDWEFRLGFNTMLCTICELVELVQNPRLRKYSHLSNKREVMLTDFEKFHPPRLLIS
jgi:hypothetical protein